MGPVASPPMIATNCRDAWLQGAATANEQLLWPERSIRALREAEACRWSIGQEFGGWDWPVVKCFEGYAAVGRCCLTTAFIFSQREAVVRRLRVSRDRPLARAWLPRLAEGSVWASVGVAQLTSSRQHLGPSLRIERQGQRFRLQGHVPWLTGAAASDLLLVGARDAEGNPFLAGIPKGTPGCVIQPPLELLALRGSLTTEVHFQDVELDDAWLLEDRAERIGAGDGAGGLTTSCLALALVQAAVDGLDREAQDRPYLADLKNRFEQTHARLWDELLSLAQQPMAPSTALIRMRARATEAALRATQTLLTVCKGVGFVHPHLAQRLARQALFFLVWSCPRPTADALLECLTAESLLP